MCSAAYAADSNFFASSESASMQQYSPVISFGYIVQLIFSLAVVMGFIYMAAKYMLPKMQTNTKGKYQEIKDKLVLEPQVTSYVIGCGNTAYLVIVSNKSATVIDKISLKELS
ncbi:MAG: hypothetical protein WCS03_19030 [Bacteroidota bacterium]